MTTVKRLCDDLRLSRQIPQTSNEAKTTVLKIFMLIRHILLHSRREFTNKSMATIIFICHVSAQKTDRPLDFLLYTDVIPQWISSRQPSSLFSTHTSRVSLYPEP